MTYNVAGLPGEVSSVDPVANTPRISPLLNLYDIVVVQEDFTFHPQLARKADHDYQSEPFEGSDLIGTPDGLNRFSIFSFEGFSRVTWEVCHGVVEFANDCLTPKGLSMATHTLAPGVTIDIYNLHHDAGLDDGDFEARDQQIEQLVSVVEANSGDGAVIVAGDTNMSDNDRARAQVQTVVDRLGLTNACALADCDMPDRVDRVYFRGSSELSLELVDFQNDPRFVDDSGDDLSDHKPVNVALRWRRLGLED